MHDSAYSDQKQASARLMVSFSMKECYVILLIASTQGHSTPALAAVTATRFNAKRLLLNRIGHQFLPNKNRNLAWGDTLLLDEVGLLLI